MAVRTNCRQGGIIKDVTYSIDLKEFFRSRLENVIPLKGKRNLPILAVILAVELSLAAAHASETHLKPLEDTTATMEEENVIAQYAFARCAGLYDGIIAYGGGNLPAEMKEDFQSAGTTLSFASAVMKQKKCGCLGARAYATRCTLGPSR